MSMTAHITVVLFSAAAIWIFAGMLIGAVNRVSHRLHKTAFIVAFLALGLLTSISEISVAFNSLLSDVPQVSAGNLVGASFVIFLLIIPFLAVAGRGIRLYHTLSFVNLFASLFVIALPALFVLDGLVTRKEGLISLFAYGVLIVLLGAQGNSTGKGPHRHGTSSDSLSRFSVAMDFGKIAVGGFVIFVAAHFLVSEAVYFSALFGVPGALIGLVVLSIGTNVPELVIAVRSIVQKHKDIAFGDYLGSAAVNTLIFGVLSLVSGGFAIEQGLFVGVFVLTVVGLVMFFIFAHSGRLLSRNEGLVLLFLYLVFLWMQIQSAFLYAT